MFSRALQLSIYILLLPILLVTSQLSFAEQSPVEAKLISDHTSIRKGETVRVGMLYTIAPDWHIYWKNPGDSGLPTNLSMLTNPDNDNKSILIGELKYPTPQRVNYEGLINYGYKKEVLIYTDITINQEFPIDKKSLAITAQSSFLMCKESCIPGEAKAEINIPVTTSETSSISKDISTFDKYESQIAQPLGVDNIYFDKKYYYIKVKKALLGLSEKQSPDLQKNQFLIFIPEKEGVITDNKTQAVKALGEDSFVLRVEFDEYGDDNDKLTAIGGILQVSGENIATSNFYIKGSIFDTTANDITEEIATDFKNINQLFADVSSKEITTLSTAISATTIASSSDAVAIKPSNLNSIEIAKALVSDIESKTAELTPEQLAHQPNLDTTPQDKQQADNVDEDKTTSGMESSNFTLWTAIAFAFVAGLILNLMPCVLPVLSIKAIGLVHHSKERWGWLYGLAYTAGVLLSFYILAYILIMLKTGGQELGWGFQLQSPLFVGILILLLFLIALELFGVYEIGTTFGRLQNLVYKKHGFISTFLSGVLITAVATPCTVPFMGGAIAYSLSQPAMTTYYVFLALGFGLAVPYLLLTMSSRFLNLLPQPGIWEKHLQQFFGFPMLATALWLIWVFGRQTSNDELFTLLIGLLGVSFGAWIFGSLGGLEKSWLKRWTVLFIFMASIVSYLMVIDKNHYILKQVPFFKTYILELELDKKADQISISKNESEIQTENSKINKPQSGSDGNKITWQKWSPEAIAEAQALGKPVFVNFTADWCITCKVNEKLVLETKKTLGLFKQLGVITLKADWTKRNDNITRELQRFNRKGIPLYLIYPAEVDAKPIVLPQILMQERIKIALTQSQ